MRKRHISDDKDLTDPAVFDKEQLPALRVGVRYCNVPRWAWLDLAWVEYRVCGESRELQLLTCFVGWDSCPPPGAPLRYRP